MDSLITSATTQNFPENNYLVVEDCKAQILRDDVWEANDDHALFHFTPTRTLANRALVDCTFLDIFFNHRTQWGAPIPSTFQRFFPKLLALMMDPREHTLLLNILDPYEGYFDEERFIKTFLQPNGLKHFCLDKEMGARTLSTLFFECPLSHLSVLDDVAFPGTVIDVEGFVIRDPKAEEFRLWLAQGNTDSMFRELIARVHCAFRMWRDFNGLFVTTDKFDKATIVNLANSSDLENGLNNYIANYTVVGVSS